ncbi:hypothetical protein M406DRAFT_343624 [Cryphonectria parasitica EP155]|uniref:3-hydroxyacyl-CoA dehydrogenase n=1 Tax=Cryphonectria parasitica (strain ATCC 38755 / EP155) TaxID=660469 RepID=A0A9P4XSJ3_CRYP1|nr:uncharacterized protein M406DRAFT_343624 [Cryphonectria parasitica EP155]KAF3760001.1 hypothetical protein M406DRAFT_343624 [Cryphonectria parasitica EP155]
MASSIKTVGVVSTGVIGSSFIALCLSHGLRVLVCSPSGSPDTETRLTQYLERTWPTLDPASLHPEASITNWKFVGRSLEGYFDQVDFIQENTPEKLDLKRAIIAELDAGARPDTIIASSSSGIPASQMITDCKNLPGRVIVGHPFNPPHLMPLVEVVPHPDSDHVIAGQAVTFYQSLGRQPVLVKKELPGFVANRLQAVLLREAISLVLDGVCSAEELDNCMTSTLAPRWSVAGPFMTNVMGGGGDKNGFKHLMSHIAPTTQVWFEDIDKKKVSLDEESIEKVDASVQEMLKDLDMESFKKQWIKSLVELHACWTPALP